MRLFILLFAFATLVANAESPELSRGYRMQLDAVEIGGELYYIATVFGDAAPSHPNPEAISSEADGEMYWAGKRVTVDASDLVLRREQGAWRPAAARFLAALKNKSPFGLQGTVLMAAFKAGNESEILQTSKFAYPTQENPLLPYQRTFDLFHEETPPVHEEDYPWGDVAGNQQGQRADLEHVTPELPDLNGPDGAKLHSKVLAGGAVEWGAWVKHQKDHVDLQPLMWYLAERKGLDTLARPVQVNGQTVMVYPAEYRGWCPPELVPYYAQFGFHAVRELGPQMVLIAAGRKELREGVRRFIHNRLQKSPVLKDVTFHLGLDNTLAAMDPVHRREALNQYLGAQKCLDFYRSFVPGGGGQN